MNEQTKISISRAPVGAKNVTLLWTLTMGLIQLCVRVCGYAETGLGKSAYKVLTEMDEENEKVFNK